MPRDDDDYFWQDVTDGKSVNPFTGEFHKGCRRCGHPYSDETPCKRHL